LARRLLLGWEWCCQVEHAPQPEPEVTTMTWEQIAGSWKQMKGKLKQQWGKLTDDDLDVIDGKREELLGKLQQRYGIEREQAERQLNAFSDRL
jgi:uncharacterized protein YjbJ (UPF0337 family)